MAGSLQDRVESMNTRNMCIFNTHARHLNYIAEHGICRSDHYKNASGSLKDETMLFHPWMKVKYTIILG
jgi:hypothetical protein